MAYDINPLHTFSNFVVRENNQFAYAVCQAVAKRPGENYNPLFIYGDNGVGKTHLMHAIVHQCHALYPSRKVFYVTSDKFIDEVIDSTINGKNSEFRNKHRNIEILLIDDIHVIATKEIIQEELFYIFNYFTDAKKQIIVSSDKPPQDIKKMEERVRNSFSRGIIVDIQPPGIETMVAILALLNTNNED